MSRLSERVLKWLDNNFKRPAVLNAQTKDNRSKYETLLIFLKIVASNDSKWNSYRDHEQDKEEHLTNEVQETWMKFK